MGAPLLVYRTGCTASVCMEMDLQTALMTLCTSKLGSMSANDRHDGLSILQMYANLPDLYRSTHQADDEPLSFWYAGISRDSLHKRRLTGGKQKKWRKKRK